MKKILTAVFVLASIIAQAQLKLGNNPTNMVGTALFQINGGPTNDPVDNDPGTFIFDNYNKRVGIGTTAPQSDLDVVNSTTRASLGLRALNGGHKWFLNSETNGDFLLWDGTAGAGPFIIKMSGALGKVGINNNAPTANLDVNGTIKANSIEGPSDIRFKKNITPLQNSLDKITSLKGYNYEWKRNEFPQKNFKKGTDMGLIAQEVEKVYPEVVFTADDEMKSKSIDYSKLVPALVESIKELKNEVDHLKSLLNAQQQSMQANAENIKE